MTRKELKKTQWAKRCKKETITEIYELSLDLALNPDLQVLVYKSTALEKPVWAISVQETNSRPDDNFWMDTFKTKKEAVALCKEMKWKIVK